MTHWFNSANAIWSYICFVLVSGVMTFISLSYGNIVLYNLLVAGGINSSSLKTPQ